MAIGPPTAKAATRPASVSSRSSSDRPATTMVPARPGRASTRAVPSTPSTLRSTTRGSRPARRRSARVRTPSGSPGRTSPGEDVVGPGDGLWLGAQALVDRLVQIVA